MFREYDMAQEKVVELDPDDVRGRMCALNKMAGRYHNLRAMIALAISEGSIVPEPVKSLFLAQQSAIDDERGYSLEERAERLARMIKSARGE